ncbi:protein ImuB [Faunimonas pinastri]|uniref:DNA-directed DNA polymerase n=1 Tax=Faunimonas pinastri TaxID=1855383 RepID=A0A1H9MEX2_9HYPH|nr:protein ImuB [Faunimonas pinastri]
MAGNAPPEASANGANPPPRAVVSRSKGAFRLAVIDGEAERRGLRPGMSLADARGAVPDLAIAEIDEAADREALVAIADWCDRYTPLVALDVPHGLFLDISGCTHLFARQGEDGETALRSDLLRRLRRQGFEARAAIASTAGAAWGVAHGGGEPIVLPGGEREALAGLPVAALRIGEPENGLLDRLGLKRIGQLVGQPRAPLAARFGLDLVRRLDQALGHEDEVLSPRLAPPALSAERRFAEPVCEEDSVRETVRSLGRSLAEALERQALGARLLELALFRVDGGVARISLGTARPMREADRMTALFAERLSTLGDSVDPGFGFDTIRLSVVETGPLGPAQIDLAGEGGVEASFDHLVDRLGARLGSASVMRFVALDSHLPERAVAARPLAALAEGEGGLDWPLLSGEREEPALRPLRLFERPEPVEVMAEVPEGAPVRFRWRRTVHEVRRSEGPERIAPEWWLVGQSGTAPPAGLSDERTRDYYRVEDAAGRRYWLYREGLYGRETDRPFWYVHGLFA